ncbi:MAG TPA: peptidase M23 [Gammaproteobacteria bacterium]|nr:peptidase M23 [Gammaproteobacteria bacterium]
MKKGSRAAQAVWVRCLPYVAAAALQYFLLAGGSVLAGERDTEERLHELRERIGELQGELEVLQGRERDAQQRLRATEKKIGRLARSLRDLKLRERRQQALLEELESRQRQHREQIREHSRALSAQLRTAYLTGRQEYLKMLLNQQDPQKIGRILRYYDYFSRARAERIAWLRSETEQLRERAARIERERQDIARLQERQRARKRELEQARHTRAKAVATLRKEIGKGDRRLKSLRQDEQRLSGVLERLKRERAASLPGKEPVPFGSGDGAPRWPVAGAIQARFGSPRSAELRWKGVLIQAEEGQPVHAIAAGKVVFADWLRGYGLLVILDHGSGYLSLYGHNQSLQKEVGSRVRAGEIISTVGNSGGNERAGLYFEIRHNGQPVDPARWCVARK